MYQDTKLVWRVNFRNIHKGKPVTVVSWVSPSTGAREIYVDMICHIGHFHSRIYQDYIKEGRPFVDTPSSMLQHLLSQHCHKPEKPETKHLPREAVQYFKSVIRQINLRQFVSLSH